MGRGRCAGWGSHLGPRQSGHVSVGRRNGGTRERAKKVRRAREALRAHDPAQTRSARHRPQDCDTPNPDRSPNPGLFLGDHALLPYPHRPGLGSGVAAPTSSQLHPPAAPEPRGEPGWGCASRDGGRAHAGFRGVARVCSRGLTAKGSRAMAGPAHSPKYTVLSHLGHLEAMVVGAPGRLAPSASARLLVAAASPAPPAPPDCPRTHWLRRRGGALGSLPPGPEAWSGGAAGAGVHLPGGRRRAGGGRTCLVPLCSAH